MSARLQLRPIVAQLAKLHGCPEPPALKCPLEMVLWENVVYLADDEKRQTAFDALRREIGLSPANILAANAKALGAVTRVAGILPDNQVEKLRRIAEIAQDNFDGDLDQVMNLPPAEAKRALKKFPAIGDPGAEKILLFCKAYPIMALDSNGLRVLLRLGFGQEQKNYAASYRSAQEAATKDLKADCAWLIRAHQLLRHHGQHVCKRTKPRCEACPLTSGCNYFQTR